MEPKSNQVHNNYLTLAGSMDLAETTEGNGSVDFRHNGLTHRKVERQIIQRIQNGHRNDQISKDWKPIQVMKLFKSKPPTSDLRAAEEAVLKVFLNHLKLLIFINISSGLIVINIAIQ